MIDETSSAGTPAYHTVGIGTGPANLSLAAPFGSTTAEYERNKVGAGRRRYTLWVGEG
jgi:hypothetical protein